MAKSGGWNTPTASAASGSAHDRTGRWPGRGAKAEELFCYAQTKFRGNYHISCRGQNRAASGFYPMATYHYVEFQPSDTEMRYNEFWAKWCEDNAPPDLK